MLRLSDVVTHYGALRALKGVSLEVRQGEIVCLLGGNASGKSTTMKTILGMVHPSAGRVEFEGDRIDHLPTEEVVRRGISLVPEARRIFGRMTVWENLLMGSLVRRGAPAADVAQDVERAYALFPRLRERAQQLGGPLSGGEQQMLAIGRALMARPRPPSMDEPSLGPPAGKRCDRQGARGRVPEARSRSWRQGAKPERPSPDEDPRAR